MKKLLAIFTFLLIGSREVLAVDYFYFKPVDGMVNNQNECYPFCESEVPSVGNVSLSIPDGITMESDEYLREIDFDIVVRDGANLSDVIITQSDLDVDNVVVDKDSQTITVNRSEGNIPGTTKLTITAKIGNSTEYEEDFSITIASSCDNPIDKDGYIILCDSSQNYLISSADDLLHISHNQNDSSIGSRIRSGNYKLTNDIYFDIKTKVTKSYDEDGFLDDIQTEVIYNNVDWDGDGNIDDITTEGWIPLADYNINTGYYFTGTFDGNGYKIGNFYINRTNTSAQAFLGRTSSASTVRDINFVNAVVLAKDYSAILSYRPDGLLYNCHVDGVVKGGERLAGLAATHPRNISLCSANVSVLGTERIGGIAGHVDTAVIVDSYASGYITSTANYVGGIIGGNSNSTVRGCYSNAEVKGVSFVGGITGYTNSAISNSYAIGKVKGTTYVGGLIGYSKSLVSNSYSGGSVLGSKYVGGLIGYNDVSIINSYSLADVIGSSYIGGLVGYNPGSVSNVSDKCFYTNSNIEKCTQANALYLKKDLINGIWDDDVWEDVADLTPKLEWEIDGDVASNIEITIPSICEYEDTLEGIAQENGYYLIGNSADGSKVGDSELAKKQLLCMSNNQTAAVKEASYKLAADVIFASNPADEDWNGDNVADGSSPEGWNPLMEMNGIWDGNSKVIHNLYIDRPNTNYQGFFGTFNNDIENISIENVYITGKSYVGGIAGYQSVGNTFTMTNSYVAGGEITGTGSYVGGLTGLNYKIYNSFSNVAVSGVSYIGGLVGLGRGVEKCYVSGNVTGTGSYIGGLLGAETQGSSYNSYATGNVLGGSSVGGLIGNIGAWAGIRNSYFSGRVQGTTNVGGIIGSSNITTENYGPLIIANSYNYSSYPPSGTTNVGALMGKYNEFVVIDNKDNRCAGVQEASTPLLCSIADIEEIQQGDAYSGWSTSTWKDEDSVNPHLGTPTPQLLWEVQ